MMKAECYSVWLMPDAAWGGEFQTIVDDLASRFSTPRFQPHLTLIGGQPFDREDLKRRLVPAVTGAAQLSRPILDVVTGDAFFRSFYALFGVEGGLGDLRRHVNVAVLGSDPGRFMPHVSLLYGAVAPEPKAAAAAEVRTALAGRMVTFDRIEIVRSGDDVPIEDWESVAAFALA